MAPNTPTLRPRDLCLAGYLSPAMCDNKGQNNLNPQHYNCNITWTVTLKILPETRNIRIPATYQQLMHGRISRTHKLMTIIEEYCRDNNTDKIRWVKNKNDKTIKYGYKKIKMTECFHLPIKKYNKTRGASLNLRKCNGKRPLQQNRNIDKTMDKSLCKL